MKLLGAEVVPVDAGTRTLKDAINEALRDWVTQRAHTHYCIGSVVGPHPFPTMVRDFQRVIGDEARAQIAGAAGRLPDVVVACVGGGCNAIGMFRGVRRRAGVALVGVEAGGHGHRSSASTPRRSRRAGPACCTARGRYVLQDDDGQIARGALDLGRARLPGRRARSTPYLKDAGRATTSRRPTTRRSRVPGAGADRGHPARRSRRRTRSAGC